MKVLSNLDSNLKKELGANQPSNEYLQISVTCFSRKNADRLASSTILTSPLLARIAVVDISDHEDVINGFIPLASRMSPKPEAKRSSEIRWSVATSRNTYVSMVLRFLWFPSWTCNGHSICGSLYTGSSWQISKEKARAPS